QGYRSESRVTADFGFLACGYPPAAGSQLKQLYVTHDAGRTWRLQAGEKQLPGIGYLLSITFRSVRDGALTAQRGGMAVTHDGGRTWQLQSAFPPSYSLNSLARADANVVYLVASSYHRIGDVLFRSADDGRTWARIAAPPKAQFFAVSFPRPRDGVLGDDRGRF